MIFDHRDGTFRIVGVYRIARERISMTTEHRDYHSLSYRLRGGAVFRDGTGEYEVERGDVLYLSSEMTYSQFTEGEEIVAVHLDVLDGRETGIQLTPSPDRAQTDALFLRLHEEWTAAEPGFRYRCKGILYEIFGLLRRARAEQGIPEDEQSRIAASVAYMEDYYADPRLTVGRIATQSGFSEVYFRRLFGRHYGVSPVTYLSHLRIDKSLPLLRGGEYSVAEVARMVGFEDPKYFSGVFRRRVGMPPSAYRKAPPPGIIR